MKNKVYIKISFEITDWVALENVILKTQNQKRKLNSSIIDEMQ